MRASSEDAGVNGVFGGVFDILACPSSLEDISSLLIHTDAPEDDRALGFNIFTPPTLAKGSSSRSNGSPGCGRTL
jgi:hypothetical protein